MLRLTLSLTAICIPVFPTDAAEVPLLTREYARRSAVERLDKVTRVLPNAIKQQKDLIDEVSSGRGRFSYESPEAREASLRNLKEGLKGIEDELGRLRSMNTVYYGRMPYGKPEVGMVGIPTQGAFRVTQLIDDQAALGEFVAHLSMGPAGREVLNPIDVDIMLRGFEFRDAVDGDRFALIVPMHFSGTYKYETVTGATRTVLRLEPFEVAAYKSLFTRHGSYASGKIRRVVQSVKQ
jgi:hypothetical protein